MTRHTRKQRVAPVRYQHQTPENNPTMPIISQEDISLIKNLIEKNPNIFPNRNAGHIPLEELKKIELTLFPPHNNHNDADLIPEHKTSNYINGSGLESSSVEETWIQTYSGRRFNPINPVKDAIVIQDIAHSLSMLCRFTGHCKKFYSVAQHSVLVSYLCDSADAMHGLLHDGSEAYLQDIPRPLKKSGKFEAYKEYENTLQRMIFNRFGIAMDEPPSVKKADTILLATESRDLMSPLHTDWKLDVEPFPMKIEPLNPAESKNLFMKRFFELCQCPEQYEHYLKYDSIE